MLIYTGPPTPPDATHEWFQGLGPALIDIGSPMRGGTTLHLNGYSIVRAQDREEVTELLRTHPLTGSEWTIEVFELPAK